VYSGDTTVLVSAGVDTQASHTHYLQWTPIYKERTLLYERPTMDTNQHTIKQILFTKYQTSQEKNGFVILSFVLIRIHRLLPVKTATDCGFPADSEQQIDAFFLWVQDRINGAFTLTK